MWPETLPYYGSHWVMAEHKVQMPKLQPPFPKPETLQNQQVWLWQVRNGVTKLKPE